MRRSLLLHALALAAALTCMSATGALAAPPASPAPPPPPGRAISGAPAALPEAPAPSAVAATSVNRLAEEGRGLDLHVGYYGDCTRATEVGHDAAYVDGCIQRPLGYFIGHNPGPFTPMAAVPVGQVIDYYDPDGNLHRLQIVSARQWNRFWGAPPLSQPDVVAQFQTCLTLDAVWDRILDAVEIPPPPAPPPPARMVRTLRELAIADD